MQLDVERIRLTDLNSEERLAVEHVLTNCSESTVFHTVEWSEVLSEQFGIDDTSFLAVAAGRPAGLVSFYRAPGHRCRSSAIHLESVYGGPIATCRHNVVVPKLLQAVEKQQRRALIEAWTPPNYDPSPMVRAGYTCQEQYTSVLNVARPKDELWQGLHRSRRKSIRKAHNGGLELVEGDASYVGEFHRMVVSTLERAQLTPPDRRLYDQVMARLEPKGMAKFVLAKHQDKLVAGVMVLLYKDVVYGWHMASYKEHWNLAPNDYLQWELIKWASKRGFESYDFLRVEPDRLPGIAKWKMRFGGDTVACYYLQKPTPTYKLWRALNVARRPGKVASKVVDKVRSLVVSDDGCPG